MRKLIGSGIINQALRRKILARQGPDAAPSNEGIAHDARRALAETPELPAATEERSGLPDRREMKAFRPAGEPGQSQK